MRMNIEAERARLGLSKEELSRKLGISSKTYSKYIGGSPISSESNPYRRIRLSRKGNRCIPVLGFWRYNGRFAGRNRTWQKTGLCPDRPSGPKCRFAARSVAQDRDNRY